MLKAKTSLQLTLQLRPSQTYIRPATDAIQQLNVDLSNQITQQTEIIQICASSASFFPLAPNLIKQPPGSILILLFT
jgi:hypothetical protein